MDIDLKSINSDMIVDLLKEAVGLASKDVVGLDIGLSSIKAAKMTKKGESYTLTHYASVPLPEAALIEDEIQKEEEIIDALTQVLEELGGKTKNVCFGFFGPNIVTRKLQLAGGSEEEIEDQVHWEAEQYLPFPIEESSLDHHIVGENEGGGVDVIVSAVRKDVLLNYKDVVEAAGLKMKVADLSPLALSNLFEYINADEIAENEEGASWLILDVGAQKTEYIIYKDEMPIFTKEIQVGGSMITEEIQRQLGINYEEAEDLKVNTGEDGARPEEVEQIIKEINETIFSEIKKTLDFYVSSTSDDSLVGCFVTGGSVQLPGLLEGLTKILDVDVSVLNPFRAFEYDESKFDEDDLSAIAYNGAVALGLAMRELD